MSDLEGMSESGKVEWARMVTGQVYQDTHPDIDLARLRAEKLFTEYNRLGYDDPKRQGEILTQLLGSVGEGAIIKPNFRCELGCNITIGSNVHINYDCAILDNAPVTIHDNVWIAPKVGLFATNHALDKSERINGACQARPIVLEDGVWLGGHVIVLGGVTVGAGSVIGAGSVVTHDIPENVVAVGNPARVIKHITDDDKTGYLERLNNRDK
ncbi:sugar O-acetyltransferase [Bifidobacterium sp.]|jgi:maltose O-acetyltransferase|uniref:sugar O-acetyltransferase n=1 Tax=Bifidobacterium sp. TaxID=41200 RepID=UPI0025BE4A1A|nr:sugar O-acetyltransferase [Bifidobacterium sp.]MCH4160792.1 sugar O-acetyltransferase [Bifidobacterium sp.]MCH4174263.1 sugar O-acetyltransferase [Bifidobacterium sp.]MCI1635677.1 sugar O-acetyltransferase [Bifidobacterium sp.]